MVGLAVDDAGHSPVWIATLDGRSPPRRLSSLDCVRALFGVHNDVYFVGGETTATSFLYHVNTDGSGLQKVVQNRVLFLYDVSPDGKWLAAWEDRAIVLYSSDGKTRRLICDSCGTAGGEDRGITPPMVSWSRDGRRIYVHETPSGHENPTSKTYVISLPPGRMVLEAPASQVRSAAEAIAAAGGGHFLAEERVFPSPDPSVYAFPRLAAHRNIFRIRVP